MEIPLVKQLFEDYIPPDQRQLPVPLSGTAPTSSNNSYISIGALSLIGQVGGILFSVNKKTGLIKGVGNYILGGLIGGAIGLGYNEFKKMKNS